MKQMLAGILSFFIVITCIFIIPAFMEMGKSPSKEELAQFEKLPYFKNGHFVGSVVKPHKEKGDYEDKLEPLPWFLFSKRNSPKSPLPQINLDKNSFSDNVGDNIVYWLGHASTILELNGKRIGIDLVFDNASPIPFTIERYQESPLKRKDLPKLDYILITHNHYDHLEKKTIKSIKEGKFIVPLGVGAALRGWGVAKDRIVELGWDDSFETPDFKITAVKAKHFSGRSLTDGNKTLWNSYVIQTPDHNIFWGGDSGYGKQFKEYYERFGAFDWVALEIDAWNGGWPDIHSFPAQMVQEAEDLHAVRVLPIHWAAYSLGNHKWNKSINYVVEQAKGKKFELMTPEMGEKLEIGVTQTKPWWLEVKE